uniref:F-box domain-containing protein n=1 Tax=Chenopodium quinoa TaxID=63459 RepID=A0A803MWE7_CHEQI
MENSVNNGKKRRLYPCDTTNNGSSRGNGEVDRLSTLPNFLLGNILSRLPLHLAATTSVLSRRWRGLWSRYSSPASSSATISSHGNPLLHTLAVVTNS